MFDIKKSNYTDIAFQSPKCYYLTINMKLVYIMNLSSGLGFEVRLVNFFFCIEAYAQQFPKCFSQYDMILACYVFYREISKIYIYCTVCICCKDALTFRSENKFPYYVLGEEDAVVYRIA
jgi:hypothetical protein